MANSSNTNWRTAVLCGFFALGILGCSASDEDSDFDEYISEVSQEFGVDEDTADNYLELAGGNEDEASTLIEADYGDDASYSFYDGANEREPFDEYEAERAAERELRSSGYDYSYGCTVDCSGHQAGWDWAADNGYSTEGNSQSFREGTMAYENALRNRVDEMRDEYKAFGEEPY